MKNIILTLFQNLGQKLTVLFLMGTATITTGAAFSKVFAKTGDVRAASKGEEQVSVQTTPSATITPEVIDKVVTEYERVTPVPTQPIVNTSPTMVPTTKTTLNPTAQMSPTPGQPQVTTSPTPRSKNEDDLRNDDNERSDDEHSDIYEHQENNRIQYNNNKNDD